MRFKSFQQNSQVEDVSHWTKQSERLGSNPGGVYADPHGNKHYIKFYNNPQQARSEVAASKIYNLIGLHTLDHRLVQHNGKLGVATSWRDDLTPLNAESYNQADDHMKSQIAKSMHAAILTKNWDAVGLDFDNIAKDRHNNLVHLDMGGVFKWRAQGGAKDYGDDISEVKSLMDPKMNYSAHHVFSKPSIAHHQQTIDSSTNIDPHKVAHIFKTTGVSDPEAHTNALLNRAKSLRDYFN